MTALDSLSLMGYSKDDADIKKGLDWLVKNQTGDGLWNLSYAEGAKESASEKAKEERFWLSFRVARILKRFG